MSTTRNYTVQGMTCGHCVASVTEEVQEVSGVSDVDVTLETGAMVVTFDGSGDDEAVAAAVAEAGYELA